MSKIDQALRLLIIEQQLEQAEFLISHIRNGGIAVRPERVEDAEALGTLIEQSGIDMILADVDDGVLPAAAVADSGAAAVLDGAAGRTAGRVEQRSGRRRA